MEGKEWDFEWGKLQWMVYQPLCTNNQALLVSLQLEFPSQISPRKKDQTSSGYMDSVQFYQPPTTASFRSDGRPTVSSFHVLTAYGKDKKASESLQDFDLIEFLDTTGPPAKGPTDPLHMPAPNLCAEKDARGTVSYH